MVKKSSTLTESILLRFFKEILRVFKEKQLLETQLKNVDKGYKLYQCTAVSSDCELIGAVNYVIARSEEEAKEKLILALDEEVLEGIECWETEEVISSLEEDGVYDYSDI